MLVRMITMAELDDKTDDAYLLEEEDQRRDENDGDGGSEQATVMLEQKDGKGRGGR